MFRRLFSALLLGGEAWHHRTMSERLARITHRRARVAQGLLFHLASTRWLHHVVSSASTTISALSRAISEALLRLNVLHHFSNGCRADMENSTSESRGSHEEHPTWSINTGMTPIFPSISRA